MNEKQQRINNAEISKEFSSVSGVGNWISCKSKRFPGRFYYFNPCTGDSAWNLCPSEEERAKRNEIGGQARLDYPEPKGTPTDDQPTMVKNNLSSLPSTVCHSQGVTTPFSKPIHPFPVFVSQQYDTYPVQNQGIVLQTPLFNPNVWAVQPSQQYHQSCTTFNQGNIQTAMMNFSPQPQFVSLQTTSMPIDTSRFESVTMQHDNFTNARIKTSPRKRKNRRYNSSHNSNEDKKFQTDLRQVLLAKKNRMRKMNTNQDSEESVTQNIELPNKEWFKERIDHGELQLEMDSLKRLAPEGTCLDRWYIVADASVLLKNLFYLNHLINKDEGCKFMAPQTAMTELRAAALVGTKRIAVRAKRAIRHVEDWMSSGKGFIGIDPSKKSTGVYIIDCCLDLLEQGYHVVLITNDGEILKHKNSTNIYILNVDEVRNLKWNVKPLEQLIKIIIPNDVTTDSNDQKTCVHNESLEELSAEEYEKDKVFAVKTPTNLKNGTVDVEIQTDLNILNPITNPNDTIQTSQACNVNNNGEKPSLNENKLIVTNEHKNLDPLIKNKEIKLKRNISHTSTESTKANEKTNFKWRKRRTISKPESDNMKPDKTDELNVNQNNELNSQFSQNIFNNTNKTMDIVNCYDEVVESDDGNSCVIKRPKHNIITIEETANSTSNIDSESACSNFNNIIQKKKAESPIIDSTELNHVMFEITSPKMEEYLKKNMEEWVSRFVQIMEEVLTQVLQREPQFKAAKMPPPWTVQEATECVKIKFRQDNDVVDASEKLSDKLYSISNIEGKIHIQTLKPSKFMELYSYAVYLVDSLQSNINCEDLQTAAESLSKLLRDIQEPFDASRNSLLDSLNDNVNESLNVTLPCSPVLREMSPILTCKSAKASSSHSSKIPTSPVSSGKYNLRSYRKAQEKAQAETKVKFVRKINIETDFFDTLKLKKNLLTSEIPSVTSENECADLHSDKEKFVNVKKAAVSDTKYKETEKTEPKIVFNFSKCSEYEDMLKSRLNEENVDEDDIEEEEYSKDNTYLSENDECEHDLLRNDDCEKLLEEGLVEDDDNFRFIIQTMSNELKEAFLQVYSFCKSTMEDLCDEEISQYSKSIIRSKAVKAREHLLHLSKSLHSVRDNNKPELAIAALGSLGNQNFVLSVENIDLYRDLIKNSIDKAKVLSDSIDLIFNVI